jgi:hypothetical protein
VVDKWKDELIQERWNTVLLPKKPVDKEKYYSCYILYGFDNRDKLRKSNPKMTMIEIMCLLAKYWRIHKEANDDTYRHYKNLFEQMAFSRKHKQDLVDRYPEKTEEDIDNLLIKMYSRISTVK